MGLLVAEGEGARFRLIFSKYSLAMMVFWAGRFHIISGLPTCEAYEKPNLPVVRAVSRGRLYETNTMNTMNVQARA